MYYIDMDMKKFETLSKKKLISLLEESNKQISKLEAAIEYLADGVYITDSKTKTLCVNLAYEKISGTPRKHFIGKTIQAVIDEGLINVSGTLESIKQNKTISMMQVLNNGKTAFITSTPVKNKSDEIEYIVTIVRDITELIKLRNEVIDKENEIIRLKKIKENDSSIIYKSSVMDELLTKARKIAKYDSTVLITGETGTGKGLIANYIHKNSDRYKENMLTLNCAAIPSTLIESELFGYEKGAFTGASSKGRKGIFEQASKGTLFLDEIGELPLEMQSKILHAIQDKKIRKIGSDSEIDVDVRIITATNRNLKNMVEKGTFREDLYYRLNVIPMEILPLRNRRDDILVLISHFISQLKDKYKMEISIDKEAYNAMYEYDWPGNVRELENLIERLFIMSNENVIGLKDIPTYMKKNINNDNINELMPLNKAISIVESKLLKESFEKAGTVRGAAKILDIHPSTFVRKRQKYINNGYLKE